MAEYPQVVQFEPPRDLHSIERAALTAAVVPYLKTWPTLLAQLDSAKVAACHLTGVGAYVQLVVPPSVECLQEVEWFVLSKNNANLEGGNLIHGATTLAFIEKGYLSCLEIVAYDDQWNGDLSGTSISLSPLSVN